MSMDRSNCVIGVSFAPTVSLDGRKVYLISFVKGKIFSECQTHS